ncbi:MAG: FAD-binding oxidoreductase [Acidobacteriota bacterium]|nr:FAD-binding oxidoreductase [Acidobacteriota bacterium]
MNSPENSIQRPQSPEELAEALGAAASAKRTITLGGQFSKRRMAGAVAESETVVTTTGLARILKYEPRDLTISVEGGALYADVSRLLAQNKQTIPLDPPFSETATIGGVLASNGSGPRRRLYGTARDLVIGMKFATLEGKLVQSGGMVVKNVAGLDMGKLMIGSFGTLAAIAIANFKLLPMPVVERTFLLSFDSLNAALTARDSVLRSVLQPAAIDLLNPQASGSSAFVLALQMGGNAATVDRCERELSRLGEMRALAEGEEGDFWRRIRNFTPDFLAAHADGAVVRVSCTFTGMREAIASFDCALNCPVIARAGSGVCYGYFADTEAAVSWMTAAGKKGWKAVIEFAPELRKAELDLWPSPGADFEMMRKIKHMFDPNRLLNRGRLYNRI